MELRTCSHCNTVVDVESTPIRPTKARFGSVKQTSSRCPRCSTIVAAVLHDEDSEAKYDVDTSDLTPTEADAVAKGSKSLKDCLQTSAAPKAGAPLPPE